MKHIQGIDLLPLNSSLRYKKNKTGVTTIFDPLRKKYLVATPEEIVRQLWIIYLTEKRKINPKLVAIERGFKINGLDKRFDLVVFHKDTTPMMLAEFKGPEIPITQSVFDQIASYNAALQVPYALVSNGINHYCFRMDESTRKFIWQENLPF
ncbi:MAG TPA: type I restriction enzyme HsdR N-terminal domain-containing protein [Saprospiraceae bacterium]|nr:type I restriction enzyme HsdR N-terminal domain-containing protein [Saprospiraceae bacterium]